MASVDVRTNFADLACPHCGHVQRVARDGISGTCVKCYSHYRTQDVLHPKARTQHALPTIEIRCLDCRTTIAVAVEAKSSWCPTCSRHLDLSDQHIARTVCKNVQTLGTLTVAAGARLINSRSTVGSARLHGGFEGTLYVEGVLELGPGATVKGTLRHVGTLKTLEGSQFHLNEPLAISGADFDGTVACDIHARGVVTLRRHARYFGRIVAAGLIVEEGAVVVGHARLSGHSGG